MYCVYMTPKSVQLLFETVKVDGLIRLMEGENTGPINIGNPGCFALFLEIHVGHIQALVTQKFYTC